MGKFDVSLGNSSTRPAIATLSFKMIKPFSQKEGGGGRGRGVGGKEEEDGEGEEVRRKGKRRKKRDLLLDLM